MAVSVFLSPAALENDEKTTLTTIILIDGSTGVTAATVMADLVDENGPHKRAAMAAGVRAGDIDIKPDSVVQLFVPADHQGAVDALSQLGLVVSKEDVHGLVAAAGAIHAGGTLTPSGRTLAWAKHAGRNCYWDGHGAEEVDYPWGKAVDNVGTLRACQAACVEAADFACHGVLFQVATGRCYRKKDIVVEKCDRDESVDLYLRPSATVFVDRLE